MKRSNNSLLPVYKHCLFTEYHQNTELSVCWVESVAFTHICMQQRRSLSELRYRCSHRAWGLHLSNVLTPRLFFKPLCRLRRNYQKSMIEYPNWIGFFFLLFIPVYVLNVLINWTRRNYMFSFYFKSWCVRSRCDTLQIFEAQLWTR